MLTAGIRYSFATLLAGTALSATAQQPTALQSIPTAAQPSFGAPASVVSRPANGSTSGVVLRPVPRHGMVTPPPKTAHQPQHPGWDLRWRTSTQVAEAEVTRNPSVDSQPVQRQPASAAVPHTPAAIAPASAETAPHVSGRLQLAETAPDLRRVDQQGVAPVAWLGKPRRSDPFATPSQLQADQAPSGASTADYFNNPFGDDPAAESKSPGANLRNAGDQGTADPNGLILPTQANQELVLPNQELVPPSEEFVPPSEAELDTDNQLRGPIEVPQRRPGRSGSGDQDSFSLPAPQTPPREASPPPSIRQERQIEVPAAPRVANPIHSAPIEVLPEDADPTLQDRDDANQRSAAPSLTFPQEGQQDAPSEILPPPRADQSEGLSAPSRETFPPFPGREPTEADLRDRERLNQSREREEEYPLDSPRYGGGTDFLDPEGYSCEDFRQRIAAQTIDKISLDVSPPFRPDEFDVQRYEQLKADFDEKQAIRRWVGLDGRPLTTGRLRDLAYEKAVIETEQGSLVQLPINRLSEGDIAYITENWGLPQECLIEQVAYQPRTWTPTTMTWKASNLCHNPLYFEDVNLERYGHTRGPILEPLVQTAHFFGNVLVLPYKMGVHSPHECQYALGYYRPGDCAPWIKPPVPISARGAIAQAATMSGLFWLIP